MLFFMGLFIMKQLLMISPGFLLFVRKAIVAAIALHTAFFILFLFLSVPVLMAGRDRERFITNIKS